MDNNDDPEEVDISQTSPYNRSRQQDDPMAIAMRQIEQQQQQQQQLQSQQSGPPEEPMMRMMQQMMGGMGGDPNDPAAAADLPPMLKAMMAVQGPKQEEAPVSGSAYMWRFVHAVFAFGLAFYVCLSSTFNGSKLDRSENVYTDETGYGLGPRLFIIFTSVELLLQSTRYVVERGQLQGGGMLATVANSGFIPEPYANYVRVVGRYITIARTIFMDVMVIIFVLGCMAWWRGTTAEA